MMLPRLRCSLGRAIATILFLSLAVPAWADERELQEHLDRLDQELQIRDQLIRNLLDRVNELEDRQTGQIPADAAGTPQSGTRQAPEEQPAAMPEDLGELRASAAFERRLIQQGGLLLPPYTWALDSAFSYSHSSSDRVVIDGFTIGGVLVVGDIFTERIDRDIYELALTARLGLPGDSQMELRVPYAHVRQTVFDAQNQESSSETAAVGDAELAVSHQFVHGDGTRPGMLASLRWKTTTGDDPFDVDQNAATYGTGYDSIQANVTALVTSDPVVFYGALSHTANLPADKPVGRLDPGDSYGFQLGIALSLNMGTSLSIGWEQRYTRRTELNGEGIPGSYLNSGSLVFGVSHTTFSGRTFDVNASIGLTRDTPDARISLSVPLR